MFTDANGAKLASGGLSYEVDAMLSLESFDNKLSVGVTYMGSALFGEDQNTLTGIAIYGLALYGVKGHYRLFEPDMGFSPYGSLSLGLSHFSTPEITSGSSVLVEGGNAFSFGLRPEVGLDINGVLISASYIVPMKYTVESGTGNFDGTAGAFMISLGYRKYLDLF
jgi:hypothetical protein